MERRFSPFFTLATLSILLNACEVATQEHREEGPAAKDSAMHSAPAKRYLVRFKSSWDEGEVQPFSATTLHKRKPAFAQILSESHSDLEHVAESLYVVEVPEAESAADVVEKLRASEDVLSVEEDPVVRSFYRPNDPQMSEQWAHAVVKSEEAWDIGQGSHEVIVAIVDTGVDYRHPDLAANIWKNPKEVAGNRKDDDRNGLVDDVYGWDFANNDNDPMADDTRAYHGTHVAGTVGAVGDNGTGVVGHAPRVRLMPLKFLDSRGFGHISNAIKAIHYAIAMKAKIISNSWGGLQGSSELAAAIKRAQDAGILFVAAAGNGDQDGIGDNNDRVPTYPASYGFENMIAVAATDPSDQLTRFSNFGAKSVHVAAPGQDIFSTRNGATYHSISGTSMATPLVSGVAAMMMALRPDLNFSQIKKAILSTVDKSRGLSGRVVSGGRINAYNAMASIAPTDPNPSPTPTPEPSPGPSPSPTPTPDPEPTPDPVTELARPPLIGGQQRLVVTNPYVQIPIDFDVSEFQDTVGAYVEFSRPNMGFSNPNGNTPDPMRLTYASIVGVKNRFFILPAQQLPGWGIYQIRVIPLNPQNNASGLFSNPSVLELRPQRF